MSGQAPHPDPLPASGARDASAEQRMLLDAIERFCREVLAPAAAEIDRSGRSATCHLPELGRLGMMGLNLPEQHGGVGLPATALFDATARWRVPADRRHRW